MSEQKEPIFSIEKIYLKDISLEVPNAPKIFLEQDQPEIQVQLGTESQQVDEGVFDVCLTVTITAKLAEKTVFLCEVAQAGIFQIRHLPMEEVEPVLGVTCPNILFPYAREAISNMISRAGFPPVWLSPINFEALYLQQKEQQASAGNA